MSLMEMSPKTLMKPEEAQRDEPKQEMKRKVRIVSLAAKQAICVLYVIWETRGGHEMTITLTREYIRKTNLNE